MGNRYTWRNLREKQATIFSRLDHAPANRSWVKVHPHSIVKHLPAFGSNRAPILLEHVLLPILITVMGLDLKGNCFSQGFLGFS